MDEIEVRTITAAETHELRRRVLRPGRPGAGVDNPRDHDEDAWHLGAFAGPRLAGTLSLYTSEATTARPGRRAAQFRFMAVDSGMQRLGIGRRLLDAAVAGLRERGVETVWANARDTALGFYQGYGFETAGEGFVHGETGLPHHVIVLDLDRAGVARPRPHNPRSQ